MLLFLLCFASANLIPEDRKLVSSLFENYGDRLYRYTLSILHQQEDAEDVVEQVFLSYMLHLNRYREISADRAWFLLRVMARNQSLDLLRRRKLLRMEDFEQMSESVAFEAEDPLSLSELLAALNENSREVLLLHYSYGFAAKEIAEILGISRSAAEKRIQRAKAELERYLVKVGETQR